MLSKEDRNSNPIHYKGITKEPALSVKNGSRQHARRGANPIPPLVGERHPKTL